VNELAHMRRAYDAIEGPNEESFAAAREVLLGVIGSSESRSSSRRRRRSVVVAIAVAILVGVLLVTPALGLGGRLLDLIRPGAPAPPPAVHALAWSPNARKIAFVSRGEGNRDVYVVKIDGSGLRNLTRNPAADFAPLWSPDGRKIAFESDRERDAEIYVMNADGSAQTNLSQNPDWDATPAWSPDGKKIAFESGRDDPQHVTDIWVMNADGSNPVRLAPDPAFDHDPTWSPDGKKIAFDSFRQPCGDTNGCYQHIWSMNADGTGLTQLTPMPRFEYGPDW